MTVSEHEVRARNVPLLVGLGGGVNSLAALVGMRERDIVPDLITFADTKGEKRETYRHLENVTGPWLARVGFPAITVVQNASPRAGDASLEAECLRRETMPSRAFGLSSCAMRWKIEPQEKFLNHWPPAVNAWARGLRPIKVLGYDGGEQRRAEITEDKKLRYWYPLIEWDWDREECVSRIAAAGLSIPPKSACFFCPSSTKTEILQLRRDDPEQFARAVRIESTALGSTRHQLRNIKGLGRHFAWGDLARMSPEERLTLPEAPVEACVRCDDDGCAP